jgi:fluoride exporter
LTLDDHLPIDPDLAPSDPAEPAPLHHPSHPPIRRSRPDVLAAIVAGGFLGTVGRYEVALAWPSGRGQFPAAIFTINTSGALAIGFVLALILARLPRNRYVRPFVGVGVIGGWTTMSTLAVDTDLLVRDHAYGMAGAYVGATLVAGLAATILGLRLARTLVPAR